MCCNERYESAKQVYAKLGIDTEAVMAKLKNIPVSLHCWQGDDVKGFDQDGPLTGGIQTTGNYPGKASITLSSLSKTAPTKVKIMLDGKKVYEADVSSATGNATVTFDIAAGVDISQGADIYYNDTYIATREVKR